MAVKKAFFILIYHKTKRLAGLNYGGEKSNSTMLMGHSTCLRFISNSGLLKGQVLNFYDSISSVILTVGYSALEIIF